METITKTKSITKTKLLVATLALAAAAGLAFLMLPRLEISDTTDTTAGDTTAEAEVVEYGLLGSIVSGVLSIFIGE